MLGRKAGDLWRMLGEDDKMPWHKRATENSTLFNAEREIAIDKEYHVEKILAMENRPTGRHFRIQWLGFPGEDSG
jgi:hypothetical protein